MHTGPICSTCGTQFATLPPAHASCPVCADERQYVGWQGQRWTDLAQLGQTHRIHAEDDAGLFSLDLSPGFAIGQRMALLPTPGMNLLWESLSLVTDEAVAALHQRGGVDAIAISHPHFYAAMLEWSEALDDVPILLHDADRDWVRRPSARIEFWRGDALRLNDELQLLHLPGHFPGSAGVHWRTGPTGGGALLPGDALQVVGDRRHVSFMYSYPNLMPLPLPQVRDLRRRLQGLSFDSVYGFNRGRNLLGGAQAAVDASFERYLRALDGAAAIEVAA